MLSEKVRKLVDQNLAGGYIKYENNYNTCFNLFSLLDYFDKVKLHVANIVYLLNYASSACNMNLYYVYIIIVTKKDEKEIGKEMFMWSVYGMIVLKIGTYFFTEETIFKMVKSI